MKKIILVIIALILVGIGVYFIIPKNSYNAVPNVPASSVQSPSVLTPEAPAASNAVTIPPTTDVTINIKNFSFDPNTINIKAGTKVTWINNDNVAHTVTSVSDNILRSPVLAPGQSFSFTFTDPGSINYHCSIHTTMKGAVIVTN